VTSTPVVVVLCTVSSEEEGRAIAATLVERRHAACVNLIPSIRSVFRWEGKVCDETEQLLIIKTTQPSLADAKRTIQETHSYELPEILALAVSDGDRRYLEWVTAAVLQEPGRR
jgi:periplasmic divalent cation tolerance protein